MESLKNETKVLKLSKMLEKNFDEAMKDDYFRKIVTKLNRPKKELQKITSKLEDSALECKNCKECRGLFECKNKLDGYISKPEVNNDKVVFTYTPCKYMISVLNRETNDKKLSLITMKDIDTKDKKQLKIIKWMDNFIDNYDILKGEKGLYLHGSFGSGKTFLMTALLNTLHNEKKIKTEIICFADTLRDLKDDFENFSFKMKRLMEVDILMFDDIGAEKVTEWSRDEVFYSILQYRMNNNKTTFFTSNLTIDELELHLSVANNGVDKVKSRRIIERIKQLTIDAELVSENRRK